MKWIVEMFEDANGGTSCMRVMAFIALFAAIALAFSGKDSCVGVFLAFSGGGHIAGKFVEGRNGQSGHSEDQ